MDYLKLDKADAIHDAPKPNSQEKGMKMFIDNIFQGIIHEVYLISNRHPVKKTFCLKMTNYKYVNFCESYTLT